MDLDTEGVWADAFDVFFHREDWVQCDTGYVMQPFKRTFSCTGNVRLYSDTATDAEFFPSAFMCGDIQKQPILGRKASVVWEHRYDDFSFWRFPQKNIVFFQIVSPPPSGFCILSGRVQDGKCQSAGLDCHNGGRLHASACCKLPIHQQVPAC